MERIQNFGDKRHESSCLYCGGVPETREHIPSRVFLDEPYPENLSTVGACQKCNQKYSLDEEYVASLIECAKIGSTETKIIMREKVRRVLENKPALLERLKKAMVVTSGKVVFKPEVNRVNSVLSKFAQCHLLFEQNSPRYENPVGLNFGVLESLTNEARDLFENPPPLNLLPEVGSRGMHRILFSSGKAFMPWIDVQTGNYRYLVPDDRSVRIVIGEYLWCEAKWD